MRQNPWNWYFCYTLFHIPAFCSSNVRISSYTQSYPPPMTVPEFLKVQYLFRVNFAVISENNYENLAQIHWMELTYDHPSSWLFFIVHERSSWVSWARIHWHPVFIFVHMGSEHLLVLVLVTRHRQVNLPQIWALSPAICIDTEPVTFLLEDNCISKRLY